MARPRVAALPHEVVKEWPTPDVKSGGRYVHRYQEANLRSLSRAAGDEAAVRDHRWRARHSSEPDTNPSMDFGKPLSCPGPLRARAPTRDATLCAARYYHQERTVADSAAGLALS